MSRSKLVVEGETDRLFFEALIQQEKLEIDIEPRHGITKIPDLLEALFDDLRDGVIEHLAIIADADYTNLQGIGGFHNRWQQLTKPLIKMGYKVTLPSENYVGSIFTHDNGLPLVGLWIMPDHKNDGMLEDLIKQSVNEEQQLTLLQTATTCVEQLPFTLFKPHNQTKAIIYTWLAWQKKPGQALVSTINAQLINLESPEIQALRKWLHEIF